MDCIMRWFTRFLVAISGLIFIGPASAVITSTHSEALSLCEARAAAVRALTGSGSNDYTHEAKCIYGALTPKNGRRGAYACVQFMIRNDSDDPTRGVAGWCSLSGGPSSFCTGPGCRSAYDSATITITDLSNVAYSNPNSSLYAWTEANECSGTGFESTTLRAPTPTGSGDVCYQGCQYSVAIGYVGTYPNGYLEWSFLPTNSLCAPTDDEPVPVDSEEPPEDLKQDADGDGILDGDDVCPNDPTNTCQIPDDSKDSDGDAVPDYKDPYPNDPTNGKGDGNGSGDGNTSSGGGDCVTPPTCGGDPIQCNILFQVWAHRCGKTGGTAGEGPTSGSGGVGNDPWEGKLGDPGSTDLSGFMSEETVDGSFLDDSGLGLPRSCPDIDTFDLHFFGSVKTIDFGSSFCQGTSWVGSFIVLLGVFVGIMAFFKVR